jgi:hypothetical protein
MTTKTLIVVLLVLGYVACLPVLLWGLADIRHIPGGVWRHAAQRPRAQWRSGMIAAYALGGWPVIGSMVVWRRSAERHDLLEEWDLLRTRKRQSRLRAREAAREAAGQGVEPMIVLSDYED